MKLLIPTEYDECVTFAEYLTAKKYLFSHIPSETFTKFWGVRMKNQRMGVRKGLPDYIIIVKDKLVFIEMKRQLGAKGGKHSIVSPEQTLWLDALSKCGAKCFIAYGAGQAMQFIESVAKA